MGLLLVVLLPLAEPACAVYLPFLVGAWATREPSRRWKVAGLLLALLALVGTPFPTRFFDGHVGARLLAFALEWAPVAGLVGLLPFVPAGALRAWRLEGVSGFVVRAWLAGAALHVLLLLLLPAPPGFAFGWEGLTVGLPLVVLVVTLGVDGLGRLETLRRRRVARVLLGAAVAASLFLVIGPLETWLLPGSTPPAGRLWRLARVVERAGETAGADGWVAFDVGSALGPYETERLADLVPGHRAGALETLPLGDLDGNLALVTRFRPQMLDVVTLGGRGIYRQEAVLRLGPWLVLRASRP